MFLQYRINKAIKQANKAWSDYYAFNRGRDWSLDQAMQLLMIAEHKSAKVRALLSL